MGRLCDFLFFGAGIVPVFLFLAGEPALAALAAVFLCIAAGVCGIGDEDAPHNAMQRPRADDASPPEPHRGQIRL